MIFSCIAADRVAFGAGWFQRMHVADTATPTSHFHRMDEELKRKQRHEEEAIEADKGRKRAEKMLARAGRLSFAVRGIVNWLVQLHGVVGEVARQGTVAWITALCAGARA